MFAGLALLASGGVAAIVHAGHRAPAFELVPLTDQAGQPRTLGAWRGRALVLDFMYTACGDVCPIKSAQLARVQAALPPALRSRVQFVSVSIDPDHDDPAALRDYAARVGANLADWAFLTGDVNALATIAAAFDAPRASQTAAPDHVTIVWLIDPGGHVVTEFAADPLDETRLQEAIAKLAADPIAS